MEFTASVVFTDKNAQDHSQISQLKETFSQLLQLMSKQDPLFVQDLLANMSVSGDT